MFRRLVQKSTRSMLTVVIAVTASFLILRAAHVAAECAHYPCDHEGSDAQDCTAAIVCDGTTPTGQCPELPNKGVEPTHIQMATGWRDCTYVAEGSPDFCYRFLVCVTDFAGACSVAWEEDWQGNITTYVNITCGYGG